jgi:hypothetical protein
MKLALIVLSILVLSPPVPGSQSAPPGAIEGATEGYFSELIDHRRPHEGVFQQRFYINSSFADGPSSPVILLICGEYNCDKETLLKSYDEGGIDGYVRELHAHLVILEHRYYGRSQPFSDLSTRHLRFLKTDQALGDLVSFHRLITTRYSLSGPWISIGGSYAGMLSALFRTKHPELVVGALSSSGPVRVAKNYPDYDLHLATALGPQCADKAREVIAYFEEGLQDPTRMQAIRQVYQMPSRASDLDVLDSIEGVIEIAVQYGSKDAFCARLLRGDAIEGWLATAKEQGAVGDSAVPDLSDIQNFSDRTRQWTYQTCVEYGFFQTAYSDSRLSVLPRRDNLAHQLEPCRRYFGRSGPHTGRWNQEYYRPLFYSTTTNILFTNAADDPFTGLGVVPGDRSGLLHPGLTAFEYSVFGHHGDLKPTTAETPASVLEAKRLFLKLARQWLQEY